MRLSFRQYIWGVGLLLVWVLAACSPNADVVTTQENALTPQFTPTPLPATAIPTVDATAEAPQKITLWLPDALVPPVVNEDTPDLLGEQIAAFTLSESGVTVEVRRKRLRDAGGIMQTLRTGKNVAPGVIPDLTLIRREDLLTAVNEGLVQPMEGIVSTAIIGELYPNALTLGQVNNTLYGLPYSLEVQHVILDSQTTLNNTRLESYLATQTPFIFPALRANGLNNVFLVQYLSAGGTVADNGALVVNESVLLDVLEVYEQAVDDGLVQPDVLNFARSLEYRTRFNNDDFGSALVTSSLYLELLNSGVTFDVASIPTLNGEPITALDGWIWVMTTNDPNQQEHVTAFLDWMLDANRQGEYMYTLNLLPSQRSAMRRWYSEDYDNFIATIMGNTTLPYGEMATGTTARAIQSALVSVIGGERSASDAVQDVLNQQAN